MVVGVRLRGGGSGTLKVIRGLRGGKDRGNSMNRKLIAGWLLLVALAGIFGVAATGRAPAAPAGAPGAGRDIPYAACFAPGTPPERSPAVEAAMRWGGD